jgi:hypothetical protein
MSKDLPNLAPKPDTEDLHAAFDRVDNRWDFARRNRDWIVIAVLVIIYLAWTGIVFLFEPGIR